MSTDLVRTTAMPVRCMDDLTAAGKLLAQSGMFGISKEADGFVIAATCHQQGMSLLEFRETYHIIHGTPSMRTDTMLARLVDHGGEYEILSRTPDRAAIRATCGKASGEFELTWEQAQLEPFVYAGKEGDVVAALASGQRPPLKDKYATPRSRMQMIWARVVSDAVRAVCPQACKGTYTPEEVSDYAQPAQARREALTPEQAVERATVVEAEVVGVSKWPDLASLSIDELRELYGRPETTDKEREEIAAEAKRRN